MICCQEISLHTDAVQVGHQKLNFILERYVHDVGILLQCVHKYTIHGHDIATCP